MRWNWKYAIIALLIFGIEVLIALFVRDRFIRPFMGDLLVVVLLFFAFKTILKTKALKIAIGVFLFACGVEVLQLFEMVKLLGLEGNRVASVILGSTFDWLDLLAYFLGTIVALLIDKKLSPKSLHPVSRVS